MENEIKHQCICIILLFPHTVVAIVKDMNENENPQEYFFQVRFEGEGIKLLKDNNIEDSQLFYDIYLLIKAGENDFYMAALAFMDKSKKGAEMINHKLRYTEKQTIELSSKICSENVKLLTTQRSKQLDQITILYNLLIVHGHIVTILQFSEAAKGCKFKQIWQNNNMLSQTDLIPAFASESRKFLLDIGISIDDDKEAILESLIKCKNYQILCDYILTKSRGAQDYELIKYKNIIDYALHIFNNLKQEIEIESRENSIISRFMTFIEGHEDIAPGHILKESLINYRSELQGCRIILKAALERINSESLKAKKQLHLEKEREVDMESILFIKQMCQ